VKLHRKIIGYHGGQITPQIPIQEISRLSHAGFSLLPLGAGSDGKGPLLGFKNIPKFPLNNVLGVMRGKSSQMYAVRLPGLLVIDIDTDTQQAHALVEKHFGVSSVQVKTPRGLHHYFRLPDGISVPKNIRQDDIAIDFKHGENSYVAGPHSTRPDGGEYIPAVGILGETPMPEFKLLNKAPYSGAACKSKTRPLTEGRVGTGKRNAFLTRKSIEFVQCVDSEADLLSELMAQRDYDCEAPETISDSELVGIASWAWALRVENRIFEGRNSGVIIKRNIMDQLLGLPYGQNAFALHCILETSHGHIPGKRFRIDPVAMKRDGLISFGRDACFQARNLLIEQRLLRRVGNYKPGSHPQHYQLTRSAEV
jgi:hypothetical protein